MSKPWLAATVHDPAGRILPGVERTAEGLAGLFAGVAVAATDRTDDRILATLADRLDVISSRHAPGDDKVGRARREAVRLGLNAGAGSVFYSDLDHILRWAEADQVELESCLVTAPEADLLVVERSDAAFAASPERHRETERLVNRVYTLMTGRDWDLMFAVRRLKATAGRAIVGACQEDTMANDVVWPLLAENLGFTLGYFAADGLSYLTTSDFDQDGDRRDRDPRQWVHRIELAAGHARAVLPFL